MLGNDIPLDYAFVISKVTIEALGSYGTNWDSSNSIIRDI